MRITEGAKEKSLPTTPGPLPGARDGGRLPLGHRSLRPAPASFLFLFLIFSSFSTLTFGAGIFSPVCIRRFPNLRFFTSIFVFFQSL